MLFTSTLKTREGASVVACVSYRGHVASGLITALTNISCHSGKVPAKPEMRTQVLHIIREGKMREAECFSITFVCLVVQASL